MIQYQDVSPSEMLAVRQALRKLAEERNWEIVEEILGAECHICGAITMRAEAVLCDECGYPLED